MTTRRQFLHTSSLATLATLGIPAVARASHLISGRPNPAPPHVPPLDAAEYRTAALHAIDAARSAGASYADVRITHTRDQVFFFGNAPKDTESLLLGIRVLAGGGWGFVSSSDWSHDSIARLARAAVAQGKANRWPTYPPIDLGPPPPATEGEWRMPVARDPFDISVEEKLDFLRSADYYSITFRNASGRSLIKFHRQRRIFASTDGAFHDQTVYRSLEGSYYAISVIDPIRNRRAAVAAPFVSPVGAGYEVFRDNRLLEDFPRMYELARELTWSKPLEFPERLDVVFDGHAMASIVSATLGTALELDRALGFEANAGGTSYAAPPETILGTSLVPSAVTITANRSMPGGAATVRWDDEGVAPEDFTLIDKGVVTNYSASRELSAILAPWYQSRAMPVRSNGCALSDDASTMPVIHSPNLELHPAASDTTFEDLIAGIDNGLAIMGGGVTMDHQQLNGLGTGAIVYRIRKGKRVGTIHGLGYLVRTPELWKDLIALGGASSAVTRGITSSKGQPEQTSAHTVKSVAAAFRNVRVVDLQAVDPAAAARDAMERGTF